MSDRWNASPPSPSLPFAGISVQSGADLLNALPGDRAANDPAFAGQRSDIPLILSRGGTYLAGRLLLFVRLVIFARLFSKADLGEYALVSSYFLGFAAISDWGFAQRFFSKGERSPGDYSDQFSFALLFSTFACGVTLALAPLSAELAGLKFHPLSAGLLLFILGSSLMLPRALAERSGKLRLAAASRLSPELVSIVVAAGLEKSMHLGVASIFIGVSAGLFVSIAWAWRVPEYRPRFSWSRLRSQFQIAKRFGLPYSLYQTGQFLAERLDTLFVGLFAGLAACGAYGICWSISAVIPSALLSMEEGAAAGSQSAPAARLALRRAVVCGVCALIWTAVFAEDILGVLLGSGWREYGLLLRLFCAAGIIRITFLTGLLAGNIAGDTPHVLGRYSVFSVAALGTAGYLLIRNYGAIGGGIFWILHSLAASALFSLRADSAKAGLRLKAAGTTIASCLLAAVFVSFLLSGFAELERFVLASISGAAALCAAAHLAKSGGERGA